MLLFYGPLAKKYEGNVGGAVNVCFLWTHALSNEKLFHRTEKLYRQVRGYVLASFGEFQQSRQTKWKRISNGINDDPLLFDSRISPFFLSRRIVTVVNEDEWKLREEDQCFANLFHSEVSLQSYLRSIRALHRAHVIFYLDSSINHVPSLYFQRLKLALFYRKSMWNTVARLPLFIVEPSKSIGKPRNA